MDTADLRWSAAAVAREQPRTELRAVKTIFNRYNAMTIGKASIKDELDTKETARLPLILSFQRNSCGDSMT